MGKRRGYSEGVSARRLSNNDLEWVRLDLLQLTLDFSAVELREKRLLHSAETKLAAVEASRLGKAVSLKVTWRVCEPWCVLACNMSLCPALSCLRNSPWLMLQDGGTRTWHCEPESLKEVILWTALSSVDVTNASKPDFPRSEASGC